MAENEKNARPEKTAMVGELRERLGSSTCAALIDFKGMTVDLSAEIRSKLRELDAEMFICKNNLLNVALKDEPYYGKWSSELKGQSALVTGRGDAVATAKALAGVSKENKAISVKCAMLDADGLDSEEFKQLASLPGKEELQGKLVATLAAPMRQLVGVLGQKTASIVHVIKAIQDKKEAA